MEKKKEEPQRHEGTKTGTKQDFRAGFARAMIFSLCLRVFVVQGNSFFTTPV
jgi:hypothetical protein